jgi:hypothetical protein
MVLPSPVGQDGYLSKYFFDIMKRVSLVSSADGNTIIFGPF